MHYVYILQCSDGSLYTGWTTDIKGRVRSHNMGKGAKYTRSRLPVELVYYEMFDIKNEALKRECSVKKLPRTQKIELITRWGQMVND